MSIEIVELVWMEQHLTAAELAQASGLERELIEDLAAAGSLDLEPDTQGRPFGPSALRSARHARRLIEDFDLDPQSLHLVLGLIDRIGHLEAQVHSLRALLPSNIRQGMQPAGVGGAGHKSRRAQR